MCGAGWNIALFALLTARNSAIVICTFWWVLQLHVFAHLVQTWKVICVMNSVRGFLPAVQVMFCPGMSFVFDFRC